MAGNIVSLMKKWLVGFANKSPQVGRFYIPSRRLPSVQIRTYCERDFEECSEIYRLNETGRFPAGYHEHFREMICSRRSLFLIGEVDGRIIGFGGLKIFPPPDDNQSNLNFGMIHPQHQKKGYGTVLLLARLAILPEPSPNIFVGLSPVELSKSFYAQFGFRFNCTYNDSFSNRITELFCMVLTRRDWGMCRYILDEAGIKIEIDAADIPRLPFEGYTGA